MTIEWTGILLAGGESRRYGSPKAFAKRDGKAFYQYSLDALKPLCSSIIVVTRPELLHLFDEAQGIGIMTDKETYKGQGPLAGIFTAMDEGDAEWYIVLPTDVPFIGEKICRYLMEQIEPGVEAVVPVAAGREQPLIAVYHHTVKDVIEGQLSSGKRSLRSLFTHINVKYVQMKEEEYFRNINRPEDL
ncbi:molybdenum cofactor guanylyltransferase [Bacillus sp. KH172YL63]|uniref:molybdenum cofactor guanylyltransferase n=1 Tax=Bacillus sp. KH172YL63 TaxID=2709784 RepID=UPI0013E51464|nr:molybdenum cofactor guanylyltransferase [Bacillus sp. KH172YL63]BCB02490.1 putative molybdenum cofactor guanylyltransferase [Bacillus sp. KH172YL63]